MSDPTTKAQLLQYIQSTHQRLEENLANLPHEKLLTSGVVGNWTVKDLMAHISSWEKLMIGWLDEIGCDEIPAALAPGATWDGLDEFNQSLYQKNLGRLFPEVQADFQQTYAQALQSVQDFPEEAMFDLQRYLWREGRPIWMLIAGNTFIHYQEHTQALEAWQKSN